MASAQRGETENRAGRLPAWRPGGGALIVYGLAENPQTVVRMVSAAAAEPVLTNSFALIDSDSAPLRLSSKGWIDLPAQTVAGFATRYALLDHCRELMLSRASQFARPLRTFIERYMDFALDRARAAPDAGPDSEVFVPEDWVFSAWLPLPRARISLPDPDAAWDGDTPLPFVEVDAAFWTGECLICVVIEGVQTMLGSRRERLRRLDEFEAVSVVRLPQARYMGAEDVFPLDVFPDGFADFRRGLTMPRGPYHPGGLAVGLPA